MEVGNEFLEAVVKGPVFLSEGFLGEFSKVEASSGFDVKGVEDGFEVFGKFIKGLFFGVNGGIGILSYHILEKSIPLPLLILFRVVMTLISSVE